MAAPYKGAWMRQYGQPYSGYRVWGTGINPVHTQYGGPPLRQDPLNLRQGEITPPYGAVPQELIPGELWGYQLEDSNFTGVYYDDRPSWIVAPEDNPSRYQSDQPPVNATGAAKSIFRATKDGAHRLRQKFADSLPSETVSEGWINKPQGSPANAEPSDPEQYEMQTSMQQRYQTRVNDHAVARGADGPRAGIESRVIGQRLKVYSGGERHYDMLPREQDDMPRPFYYRTAGTGDPANMAPNAMWEIDPIQRVTPPDPYLGADETDLGYGYTSEDSFYA